MDTTEYIDRLAEDDMPADAWEPPTCENSPGECDWTEEQVGYEEEAVQVAVCLTHGTEVYPHERKRSEP